MSQVEKEGSHGDQSIRQMLAYVSIVSRCSGGNLHSFQYDERGLIMEDAAVIAVAEHIDTVCATRQDEDYSEGQKHRKQPEACGQNRGAIASPAACSR